MIEESKGRNFVSIPIEKIEVGPSRARSRKVEREIDELSESIKRWGLIYPITVYREDDKYPVIQGFKVSA